ncbi:MAG TPA: lysozyme inhibitor LprI family protein [Thermoanaerobaculia bacterium]|nr:lysozyme inhibitor LprI family protein [Thermoanaerobaculia bacterium]
MERKLISRPFLLSLCAAGMLTTGLAAATPPTAVGDCDDAYFGITREPDFSRALRCYQSEKRWDLLIVMYLNGEGTPVDIGKAETLLQEWAREDQIPGGSLEARALRAAIEDRKQHQGTAYPRIDYCRDIARDTLTLNFCGYVDAEIEEGRLDARMEEVRRRLTPAQRALFDRMKGAFSSFEGAEGGRVYDSIGGTARSLAAMGQTSFVRAQFSTVTEEIIERHALQPADPAAYEAADRELNQVYRDDLRQFVADMSGTPSDDTRRQIALYKDAARKAQLRWLRYRDLYADLARSLYPDRRPGFDPALSLKTALTRIRVDELRHDPLGLSSGE